MTPYKRGMNYRGEFPHEGERSVTVAFRSPNVTDARRVRKWFDQMVKGRYRVKLLGRAADGTNGSIVCNVGTARARDLEWRTAPLMAQLLDGGRLTLLVNFDDPNDATRFGLVWG